MARPEAKQYTHHFTVTIGFVTRSFDGNWTSLSMEQRREIVRELLLQNLRIRHHLEGGAK